ncbi:cobyrinic acid ac-diamide synthase [Halobacteriales archaeon QS_4_62_28]|nr:MAG: cobyrinic acid ac-diamide synthase [Halobacteriales archaeon QS_4_62_28]
MIAIAGGKGGCGKTTTTACLARALATQGDNPIVVDGDCDMPDLHVLAGVPVTPGLAEFTRGAPLDDVTHGAVELPGVDVLPAGHGDSDDLDRAAGSLTGCRRPVLVDTPAGASPAVATVIRAADGVIIVTTATRESLEDATKTAAIARTVETPILGSVVTNCNGGTDPSTLLGCQTLAHVPTVDSPLTATCVRECYVRVATAMKKRNI